MPIEYKSEGEALEAAVSILGIFPKDLIEKQESVRVEFPHNKWLHIYEVNGRVIKNSNPDLNVNEVGIGYWKLGYTDGSPKPVYCLFLIENNHERKDRRFEQV